MGGPMTVRSMRGRQVYSATIGVVVGVLLTGALLPWVVGSPDDAGGTATNQLAGDALAAPGTGLQRSAGSPGVVDEGVAGTPSATGGTDAGVSTGAPSAGAAVGATPGAPGSASRATGGASDVGVTAESVTLGALLFDLGGVGRAGFAAGGASRDEQQRMFGSFVADANDAGGVAGRRISLAFAAFDPLRTETASAACLALTEDAKAFAIIGAGGFVGESITCVTEQHATPMISGQGEADEIYARSRGRLFTTRTAANRTGRVMVDRAHAQGRLKGATIGIVVDERPHSRQPIDQAVIPRLAALGYKVAHVSRLSDDVQTGQSQIPIEINQMRAKRVDLVFFAGSPIYSNLWFNQAESQGYGPFYVMSDVATMVTDFAVQAAPPSLRAVGYTSGRIGEAQARLPQPPEEADCQRRYQRRTGQQIERGSDAYELFLGICGYVGIFARAANVVGPELTRDRFVSALAGLGAFPSPGIGGTISFSPAKRDGADFFRTARVDGSCHCWIPVDEFTAAG